MVSSFSAAAAEAAAELGRLGSEGRFEEAMQSHSQLSAIITRVTSALETLSIDQLQRQRRAFG
jgi:hypothetical protein